MPPVTRSRGGSSAVAATAADSASPAVKKQQIPRNLLSPPPPPSQNDTDVIFCDQIINHRPRPATGTPPVFQFAQTPNNGGGGGGGGSLTFSTVQFRGAAAVPGTYSTAGNFGNMPLPLGVQRQAVTLRPAGLAGQQIILYADTQLSRQQIPLPLPVSTLPNLAPKTSLKHSLRLVRGATSSGWSVVSGDLKSDTQQSGGQKQSLGGQKQSPGRSRAKRLLPVAGQKAAMKRKRRSRAMDTSQTRSSTSTESFRSDFLGADVSSHSGSSNDDSKLTGADASTSSRQSSLSLEEPFGILPFYTPPQRDAMSSHFRGDTAAATRYTSLKEWAVDKGTKFFHSGNVRLNIKAQLASLLYGSNGSNGPNGSNGSNGSNGPNGPNGQPAQSGQLGYNGHNGQKGTLFEMAVGDSLSVGMVDAVRDVVRLGMCDPRVDDFKRRLCVEIIKTREREYNAYGKGVLPLIAEGADGSGHPSEPPNGSQTATPSVITALDGAK